MTTQTWQDVFKAIIFLLIALAGSPITTLFRNALSAIFKQPVEDRWALGVTGVVSALLAVLELWLSGKLDFSLLTAQTFPSYFFIVFSLSTVYFAWMKGSDTVFGRLGLLKKRDSP